MKKNIKIVALIAALCLAVLSIVPGCGGSKESTATTQTTITQETSVTETTQADSKESASQESAEETITETEKNDSESTDGTEAGETGISEDGEYTATEEVAEYIHTFGHLPDNYITKSEAKALGWDSSKGNLWDVAPGKSIGGDYFGNYEGLLPSDEKYTECDVNYEGGYRGEDRLIFTQDGEHVYFTEDHYTTFEQLY